MGDPLTNRDPCDELARDMVACARLLGPAAASMVVGLVFVLWLLVG